MASTSLVSRRVPVSANAMDSARHTSKMLNSYAEVVTPKTQPDSIAHGSTADEKSQVSNSIHDAQDGDDAQSPTASSPFPASPASSSKSVSIRQLYRYASPCDLFVVGVGCLMAVINGALFPCMSLLFGEALSHLQPINQEAIARVALWYFLIAVALFIAEFVGHLCFQHTAEKQIQALRFHCFHHILHKDMEWFDREDTAKITTQLTTATLKIKDGIGIKLGEFLRYTSQFVTGYTIGFATNWSISIVMAAVMPFMALCLSWIIKTIRRKTEFSMKKYAQAGSIAEETIGAIRTVFSFNKQLDAVERYVAKAGSAEAENIQLARVLSIVLGLFFGIIWIAYAVGLWYGAKLVSDQVIDPKTVFTTFYGILLGTVSLAQISPNLSTVIAAKTAAGQLYAILAEPSKTNAAAEHIGVVPSECRGEIDFDQVVFAYPSRPDANILREFTLKINAGETIAFVGPSGGGKSTVVALLERFYEPNSGVIRIDGHRITKLQLKWLRSQIGIVSQEPVLFATSIFENIAAAARGHRDVTLEEVEAVAKQANAHEFIADLPDGYNTQVGEKGIAMSGGQKQRIAIARALIRDPKILILDEATSALDSESEASVQVALDALMEKTGLTIIMIAHRLTTIRRASRICVVTNGRVVESGSHDDLMAIDGRYRAMVNTAPEQNMEPRDASLFWDFAALMASVHTESQLPMLCSSNEPGDSVRPSEVESQDNNYSLLTKNDLKTMGSERKRSLLMPAKDEVLTRFSLTRLMRLGRPERGYFVVGIIAAALNGLTFPTSAVLLSTIASVMIEQYALFRTHQDQVYLDSLYHRVRVYSIIYVAGALGQVVVNFCQSYSFKYMGERLVTRLRDMHFRAICRQSVEFFDDPKHGTGALTADLAALATKATVIAGDSQGRIVQAAFTFLAAVFISFFLGSWMLSLIMCIVFPMLIFSHIIRLNQLKGGHSKFTEEASNKADALAAESLKSIRTVASFGMEHHLARKYQSLLREPMKQCWKEARVNGLALGFSSFVTFAVYALVFWYGGILVAREDITARELLRSLLAIMMSANGIGQATSYLGDMDGAKQAGRRIFELEDRVSPIDSFSDDGLKPESVRGRIEFQRVLFFYPSRPGAIVLKDLSLTIEPGQTVALCGASGGGKSTIISLLERFYDPMSGHVMLDGVPLTDLNVRWLRAQIGLIGQEPVLFGGTVFENIAYGCECECTQEDVEAAARVANAHNFISQFPDGYSTSLGLKGEQLSGGQKQRIAIARAIIKNPRILLLDEATSALDATSEQLVQDALDRVIAARTRTTVIIAHRLRTIRNADKICVLANGCVAEEGDHDELLAQGGLYARLVERAMDSPATA